MFIPSGWWHSVLNLDNTLAVTQNFCNEYRYSSRPHQAPRPLDMLHRGNAVTSFLSQRLYCTKWRFQGSFHSCLHACHVNTQPGNAVVSLYLIVRNKKRACTRSEILRGHCDGRTGCAPSAPWLLCFLFSSLKHCLTELREQADSDGGFIGRTFEKLRSLYSQSHPQFFDEHDLAFEAPLEGEGLAASEDQERRLENLKEFLAGKRPFVQSEF